MKKVLFLLIISLFSFQLFAASTISGTIIDADSQNPIEFVNVTLLKQGSKVPLAGMSTDLKGGFVFSGLENGNYVLQFSFVGYNQVNKQLAIAGKPINVGVIKLEEDSKKLSEVQVVGQGSQMRFDIDKKIFSVDQNIAAAGGSATEVLQNIPSVDVDNEGNVSLRNNANVEVWINGKPSGLTVDNRAQILQQMPAESIETIEVMTNPSAKFNPEGTAGIINIVLKKNRKAGYYGSVSAGIMYADGAKPGGTLGGNISYSNNKIDVNMNIGYRGMSFKGGSLTDRYNLSGIDTLSLLSQNSNTTRAYGGIFFRGGIDYHINDKHTISLSGFGMTGSGGGPSSTHNIFTNYATQTISREYIRDINDNGMRQSMNTSLDYKWDIDKKGSNLMASVSYSGHKRGGTDYIKQTDVLNGVDTVTQNISQTAVGTNKEWLFKVDFTKKFSESSRIEAGWQSTLQQRLSPASAFDSLLNKNIEAYFNKFDYNEQIHAAYLTYGTRFFEKLSVQAGLRAEYFTRSAVNTQNKFENSVWETTIEPIAFKPAFRVFPSVYLSYTLPENNELQLNYTSRINRPRGRQINTFHDYSDSTKISYGDATLSPEYGNSLEFNYLKSWNAHSLSASVYYRSTDQGIEAVQFINNGTMESTYMNLTRSSSSGVELVAKDRLFKIVNLTTSLNLYYYQRDSTSYTNKYEPPVTTIIPARQNFSWNGRMMANIVLGKTTSAQITGEYSAPRLIAQGSETASYSIDLGLRQTFFNRNLSLNFMARDLLNSRKRNSITSGNGFYETSESYFHGRMLGLTVTYNFGNMKPKAGDRKKNDANNVDMNMDGGMD